MPSRLNPILVCSCALLALCLLALPLPSGADDAADGDRLARLRGALAAAERADAQGMRQLRALHGEDTLWPWIELSHLRRRIDQQRPQDLEAFLRQHAGQPVAAQLRRSALDAAARRQDWSLFRRLDDGSLSGRELHCHGLTARLAVGNDPDVLEAALALWDLGEPLPDACDPALAALHRQGRLDAARIELRIERAALGGHASLMRHLAAGLDAQRAEQVRALAGWIETPPTRLGGAPSDRIAHAAFEAGLLRQARRDPGAAETLLDALPAEFALPAGAQARIRHAVALWSAAAYQPEAAARLARVPVAAFDERLHEWRVREALARRAGAEALAALGAMPEEIAARPRWRLVRARLLQHAGRAEEARALLASLSREAHFQGFIAADLLGQDYALCPLEPPRGARARRALAARPGVARALDLYSLSRPGWAALEWQAALEGAGPAERALAVEDALARGWYERAAQALGSGEAMRYYRLRFPLPHERSLRQHADRHGLAPSWVAGLIRAESSWNTQARSPADARGLMQLLPSTGAEVARALGRSFSGTQALHNAELNLELGTAYLAQVLEASGGRPALATAAYNAGPRALARWIEARPLTPPLLDDPILWLETIPFHETRDYVPRVMAFSLIYDWRLDGEAGSLLARLQGQPDRSRRGFRCPAAN